MILLFLGPSGSGKDTQADILVEKFGFTIVGTGEILRDYIEDKHELGLKAEWYVENGKLVPDDLMYEILEDYMTKLKAENIIFNGVLRSEHQIELFDNLLKKLNLKLDKAVYFELSIEDAIKRLSGRWVAPTSGKIYHETFNPPKVAGVDDETGEKLIQREDDRPEAIKSRIQFYIDHIAGIIKEFEARGILITIDASKSIMDISNELINKLNLQQ